MINRVYKITNGLNMVESWPYHWIKQSIYHGQEEPYHYYISLNPLNMNDIGSLHCSYTEEDGILSINSEIKMRVENIEEAGEMIQKMVRGMGLDVSGTVYEITEKNTREVDWISVK